MQKHAIASKCIQLYTIAAKKKKKNKKIKIKNKIKIKSTRKISDCCRTLTVVYERIRSLPIRIRKRRIRR